MNHQYMIRELEQLKQELVCKCNMIFERADKEGYFSDIIVITQMIKILERGFESGRK